MLSSDRSCLKTWWWGQYCGSPFRSCAFFSPALAVRPSHASQKSLSPFHLQPLSKRGLEWQTVGGVDVGLWSSVCQEGAERYFLPGISSSHWIRSLSVNYSVWILSNHGEWSATGFSLSEPDSPHMAAAVFISRAKCCPGSYSRKARGRGRETTGADWKALQGWACANADASHFSSCATPSFQA